MDPVQRNSSRYNTYAVDKEPRVTSPSSTEKIEEIKQQVKQLISNARGLACGSKIEKPPKIKPNPSNDQCLTDAISIGAINNQLTRNDSLQTKTTHETMINNNSYCSKSMNVSESNHVINNKESLHSFLPADSKLTAYNRFIESLTKIIRETKQVTPVSEEDDAIFNSQNFPVEDKNTFVILKNSFLMHNAQKSSNSKESREIKYEEKMAEKTTYCRPVVGSHEILTKSLEKNAKLQKIVKKIILAREKEKEAEAWHNYINELKNKHGHPDVRSRMSSRSYEYEISNTIDNGYDIRHSGEQPSLVDNFTDSYRASNEILEENNMKRRIWYAPSSSKPFRYTNNTLCCPMSSQARSIMMKRDISGRNRPTRHRLTGKVLKDRSTSYMYEKRSTQYEEADILQKTEKMLTATNAIITNSRGSNCVGQVNPSLSRNYLENIEKKLDSLIDSFNVFFWESKSRKAIKDTKSAALSCSSLTRINTDRINNAQNDSNSLLSKGNNIICEVSQQVPSKIMTFSPRPLQESTFEQIMTEEMEKNVKIKKDIDNILNSTGQCAVKIIFDVPTKEHSTEVTRSLYKTQLEETATEEIKPTGTQVCEPDATMTIAVNTDPLGILALIRVSAETVKQILSYVPNLDYVSYLARRQIGSSTPIKRFACNICGLNFSRPSMLNDHIQGHNIGNTKDCCVCRFALDRDRLDKSSMFTCCHCGQTFTRAYCCELHEQSCCNSRKPRLSLSNSEGRRTITSEEKFTRINRF